MSPNSLTPSGAPPRTLPPPTDAHQALGLLPPTQRGKTSQGTPAVPYNRSLRQRQGQPQQREAELARMNEAFQKQGLPLVQRPPASTFQQVSHQVDRVADWLVETGWWAVAQLPALPKLFGPLPGGVTPSTPARSLAPGGSVYILDCPPHKREPHPAFDVDRYVNALRKLYKAEQIVRVPVAGCDWSYTQNLAKAGPGGVVLLGQPYRGGLMGQNQQGSIDALKAHFDRIGQRYVQLPHAINFANVDWFRLPNGESVLVLTDVLPDGRLWKDAIEALIEAFGTPQHLLRAFMHRGAAQVPSGTGTYRDQLCFDSDLVWKPLDGNPHKTWALVHEACYASVGYRNLHTGEAHTFSRMTAALEHLKVGVIPVGLSDAAQLVMNSVARGRRLLLPQAVTDELMSALSHTGYEVLVPEPGLELGNTDPRVSSLFAVHCVVAQTDDSTNQAPELEPEPVPKDGPADVPQDKSEL